jgi:hypothetical protein
MPSFKLGKIPKRNIHNRKMQDREELLGTIGSEMIHHKLKVYGINLEI